MRFARRDQRRLSVAPRLWGIRNALAVTTVWVVFAGMADGVSAAIVPSPTDRGLIIARTVFDGADPKASYEKLNAKDKAAFDAVELPVSQTTTITSLVGPRNTGESTSGVMTASFSGCWAMQTSDSLKAAAGNTIGTFGQSTNVCVSGGSVTSVQVFNMWNETSTPGWRIDKNPQGATYNVGWEGRGRSQHYFVLGAGGWDIQHVSPCLQLRLNADGYHFATSRSCNLS